MDFLNAGLVNLIETVGLIGIFLIIFLETGVLIGVFLPGDSLLFTAGFLASRGVFNLFILAGGTFIASVLGNVVGFYFGKKVGRRLFTRGDSFWFHKDHLIRAEEFYEKHGGKTIVLARFLPIIRVFAPIVAGMGRMHYPTFLFYNIAGGALWTIGLTFGGFILGSQVKDVDRFLIPIVVLIVIFSFTPTVLPTLIRFLKKQLSEEKKK